MPTKFLSFYILIFFSANIFNASAQNENLAGNATSQMKTAKKTNLNRNFIKTNISSILLKNYSLQYERTLNKSISIAISYRIMPSTNIPFKNSILKIVGDDPDTKRTIEDFKLSNTALTSEIRFYLSRKGYGRGFYIAPFYRYAKFKTNNIDFFYSDSTGTEGTIRLSGQLMSNTGGILFGIQHHYGKHVVLDVWLLGPHIGTGTGNFTGTSSVPLDSYEQDDIRNQLNNIDIPLTTKTVEVNNKSAALKLDGPWGGIRAGLSLGIKF